MDTALEINNLSVTFRTDKEITQAVSGVSLSLNKGETLGIVGESGSGKSVTSLAIMRLIPKSQGKITSGSILFHEGEKTTDLLQLKNRYIRKFRGGKIAMIFQEPMTSLNPVMTCGKQVAESLRIHLKLSGKKSKLRTLELFEEVKLPRPEAMWKSYPHQLSGGQKQRVMIAMAISCNPTILIADEPTTALDVTVQKTILDLLKELQQKYGMSIIFISHDLGVIAQIANRIMVMYKGEGVETGETQQILKNPQHPYTKGLISCKPRLGQRPRKLPVVGDFLDIHGQKFLVKEAVPDRILISNEERHVHQKEIYSHDPVLSLREVKTWFPLKKNFFGKPYEYVKAADHINFEVYKGETLGLVGESGCGKTTIGRTILRLIEGTGGEIIYKGEDVRKMNHRSLRKFRRDMQIIFQDPYSSLNPRRTAGEAIIEPMIVHRIGKNNKERREKVYELLRKVGLEDRHYSRYPHEFSGGQRQRIGIARVLAVNPEFIVCDESVSALDVSVQAQVLNLLNELKTEFGLTYIFISHDLSVVKYMSDRIVVMNHGLIEEIAEADMLYANPKSDYTRKLIEVIPDLK